MANVIANFHSLFLFLSISFLSDNFSLKIFLVGILEQRMLKYQKLSNNSLSKKTRGISIGVFIGVFLLAYLIGTTYKMSDEDAQSFLNDFQSSTEGIDAIGIFLHNLSIALLMFVPGFGVGWGSFTGWQTGAAFNAIISSNPSVAGLNPLIPLLASPFGLMELVAYSIGMSRSFHLVWRIIKKNPMKKEIIPSAIEIGIVIAMLLVGGIVESSMMVQNS